jgi:hypothetical protein
MYFRQNGFERKWKYVHEFCNNTHGILQKTEKSVFNSTLYVMKPCGRTHGSQEGSL